MKKILYLPVETVVRDLDANLLLTLQALEKEYEVVVGSKVAVHEFARHCGSGVYFFKHWEEVFPYPFDDERRKNYFYIGFHPEGLVNVGDDFKKKMNVTGKSEQLDVNFVYGSLQHRLLLEVNPKLKGIVKEVGHPRFDLLRPEYHYLYRKEADALKRKYGNYILINTNFTPGNPGIFYKESFIERENKKKIDKRGEPLTGEERDFVEKWTQYSSGLVTAYIEMVKELHRSIEDVTIIFRPHPSENHEVYHSALAGLQRVKVIFQGSVINWIMGADAVIQTGCTTGLEAWASHKPVIRYNPFENADLYESELPNRFGIRAKTADELVRLCQKISDGEIKNTFSEQIPLAKPFIESIDGERSFERILNHMEEKTRGLFTDQKITDDEIRSFYSATRKKRDKRERFLRFVRKRRWLMTLRHGEEEAKKRVASFQKFPGIPKRYIERMLAKLKTAGHGLHQSNTEIRKIDTDSYLIRKK